MAILGKKSDYISGTYPSGVFFRKKDNYYIGCVTTSKGYLQRLYSKNGNFSCDLLGVEIKFALSKKALDLLNEGSCIDTDYGDNVSINKILD